ncbi:Clp protease N-terminal domain-containing protein [Streptomyces sp. INA 01156]
MRGAAQYAAEHGSRDLDTQHLLRAALATDPTRDLISRTGTDPDSLAAEIDERSGPSSTGRTTPLRRRRSR